MKYVDDSIKFLKESKNEIGKVVFPSRQEVISATAVVILSVAVVSAFLYIVDMGLSALMKRLF
jgi:preprotein translocase subunit SecE